MYCILVAGMPATGKTRFAHWLSQRRGVAFASKDELKELLFDSVGFQSRAEKVRLGEAAMRLLYAFAEAHLRLGQPVILENNFEDASKPELMALLERYGCRPVTVLFDGDIEAIHRRFLAREQSPERHRGHVVNTRYPEVGEPAPIHPLSLADFAAGMEARGFRRFDVGEPVIRVDCTDFAAVDYERIDAAISRALEE
ncbi:MAG: AAA family ATPase [Clostridia bacterium]|nr:AAA family ATPase [Clostridia bacterium]